MAKYVATQAATQQVDDGFAIQRLGQGSDTSPLSPSRRRVAVHEATGTPSNPLHTRRKRGQEHCCPAQGTARRNSSATSSSSGPSQSLGGVRRRRFRSGCVVPSAAPGLQTAPPSSTMGCPGDQVPHLLRRQGPQRMQPRRRQSLPPTLDDFPEQVIEMQLPHTEPPRVAHAQQRP